ncbi:hypothetical protein N1I86_07615 [Bacillus sp. FSL W8-0116]|uniref:hypothetical protein n=1 Tax=Bacillus sp. FSL W8-0116 TaxID=2978206 RepID=UPI0030F9A648
MPQNALEWRDAILYYSEELLQHPADLNSSAIEEGLRLFRHENVDSFHIENEIIHAFVHDNGRWEVNLDLTFPSLSFCSCRQKTCSHQMAVFFALYSQTGNLQDWMEQWRTLTSVPSKKQPPLDIPGVYYASDLLKKRAANDGPEEWGKMVDRAFLQTDWSPVKKNPYLLDMKAQSLYRQLMTQGPFEREWKPLYQLFCSYFLFQKVVELCRTLGEDWNLIDRACSSTVYFFAKECEHAARELSVHAIPFAFDRYLLYLKDDLLRLIDRDSRLFSNTCMLLYMRLWTVLLKKEDWRKQEWNRLESESPISYGKATALLHQLLFLNKKEEFSALFQRLDESIVDASLVWLDYFFSEPPYQKACFLLELVKEKLPAFLDSLSSPYHKRIFVADFLRLIDASWLAENRPHLLEDVLFQLFPYSYSVLHEFYIITEHYQKWTELQLLMGAELEELEQMGLKKLEKASPECALPLYHWGISELIERKNRSSYQRAVKYLKKLRRLYKKLKREQDWERYWAGLQEKTKRLRAFHEECRKGKLIDA